MRPAQVTLAAGSLFGFLFVLSRVAGVFAFGGLPVSRNSALPARMMFALALTLALAPAWPVVEVSFDPPALEAARLAGRLLAEAAFGLALGVVVALLGECLLVAAQVLGLQAGYSYASTIDPNSEADSGVLIVLAQVAAWLLFIAFGCDRLVIRALALSLERFPAGAYRLPAGAGEAVISLGHAVLDAGLRLALPVVALLLLVDLAFALLAKLNAQLQLLALSFPAKMLAAIALLAAMGAVIPRVYEGIAARAAAVLMRLAGA